MTQNFFCLICLNRDFVRQSNISDCQKNYVFMYENFVELNF